MDFLMTKHGAPQTFAKICMKICVSKSFLINILVINKQVAVPFVKRGSIPIHIIPSNLPVPNTPLLM